MRKKLQLGLDSFGDLLACVSRDGMASVGEAVCHEEEGEDGEESDYLHAI